MAGLEKSFFFQKSVFGAEHASPTVEDEQGGTVVALGGLYASCLRPERKDRYLFLGQALALFGSSDMSSVGAIGSRSPKRVRARGKGKAAAAAAAAAAEAEAAEGEDVEMEGGGEEGGGGQKSLQVPPNSLPPFLPNYTTPALSLYYNTL